MRKYLLGCAATLALLGPDAALAGGAPVPVMAPAVVVHESSSSAGGLIVPLLLLLVIAAVASSGSGGAAPQVSDRRIKTDIAWTGMARNGMALYRYRYIGSPAVFEGVMAQEVALTRPDAVCRLPSGVLAVDYTKLGLQLRQVA